MAANAPSHAIAIERSRPGAAAARHVRVGEMLVALAPRRASRANHAEVAQHRGQRPQPAAQLFPIAAARQQLRAIQPPARIASLPATCCSMSAAASRASTSSSDPPSSASADAAVRPPRPPHARRSASSHALHQHRRDVARRQPSEPQPLAARPHRRQQLVRPRRHEHEHRRRGRLLERLEQRVLRFGHHRVRFVDDDDAPAALERPVRRPLDRPRAPDPP